ncbi:hypothetical protein F5Y10DRAFT_272259 [Nemania abortiva]|nr:hypothetical protein F5Y10DRAFT_272259 [Nemania abortiva]
MSKLPLKIQVGVRDSWDNNDAPVQKAICTLKEAVGVRVTVNPEWSLLHSELGSFYPDKATLVPSIAAAVEACCTTLGALADDEANSEWADALLERTESNIRIFVEVSTNRDLSIVWSAQQRGIILALPKSAVPSQSNMQSFFAGHLLKIFDERAARETSSPGAEPSAVDDWADVAVDNRTGNAGVVELPQRDPASTHVSPVFDVIPDVETVSRPDELLLKPPYHLILYNGGKTFIEVQCSHSPTLQFLSDYLIKWSRTNHNNTTRVSLRTPLPNPPGAYISAMPRVFDAINNYACPPQPPCAEVKLHQSAFGLGVVYDRLTVNSETTRYMVQTVSPTILLALIEGVLGYKSVSQDGSSWTFRRDVEFKSSRY